MNLLLLGAFLSFFNKSDELLGYKVWGDSKLGLVPYKNDTWIWLKSS
jgi:hypothetical protein